MHIPANLYFCGVNMKIEIKYNASIISLPSAVADVAPRASKIDLQVITVLFGYAGYFSCFEECIPLIADKLTISTQDVLDSLLFWNENGVIIIEGASEFESKMVTGSAQSPSYTGKQVEKFIERNADARVLFDECQKILGKDFTKRDYDNLMYLKETYNFSNEYIMLLLYHCVQIGKTNWAYVKKLAAELYDRGITTYQALSDHFKDRENANSLEYKVRRLFGMGDAEFTPKQREIFEKWVDGKVSFELIKYAYEISVDAGVKASMPYVAKIIENWINNGIKTVSQAKEAQEQYSKRRKSKKSTPTYGDADEAFEAALARSYDDEENDD